MERIMGHAEFTGISPTRSAGKFEINQFWKNVISTLK